MTQEVQGIPCPCCGQVVGIPSMDMVIEHCGISELQSRILGAVWRGKGRTVATQRIFDAMYADDPDGGPSHVEMYKVFKEALFRLRQNLDGSGVSIVNIGYRRGYALRIEGMK